MVQAVVDYLDPSLGSRIQYLSSVYSALPKVANEQDLFNLQPPGQGVGAVIYCFIEHQSERRDSEGGPHSGIKMRAYTLALLCILKSNLSKFVDGQQAFDEFMDSLTGRIQADRQAGTSGNPIFQWGEGDTRGAPDLVFDYPVPKTRDGGVTLFQAVGRVTVLEALAT